MRTIPWRLWALSVLSAALQLLPFPLAGPVPAWRRAFCWFCLLPLLYALCGKDRDGRTLRPAQTMLLGYACGFVWYMGNCYWIYQTMHIYGGIPLPASFGILVLFSLYVGLYHAMFGWLFGWLRRSFSSAWLLCTAPFLWVAVELARARITGFPWDLLGYTQVDSSWILKVAPWTGVMGLSFVVAAANMCIAATLLLKLRRRGYLVLGGAAGVLLLLLCFLGNTAHARRPDATAILLQENLNVGAEGADTQETKQQMLAAFTTLSLHPESAGLGEPQLIIWPEAPTVFVDSDPEFRQAMSSLAQQTRSAVIVNDIGYASRNPNGRISLYNSASLFHADGSYAGHYDKMHLVPFGEYTPYKPLFFFVGHLLDDLPFIPGEHRTMLDNGRVRYGVFICYESIFGDEIRRFVGDGADVLVNISNDGWYGDTSAPWEHLDMVRMRAIENHRYVLRSTNTGITAAISPEGQITAALPRHVRDALEVSFAYEHDLTFYTRHGDLFAWMCALLSVVMLALGFTRFTKAKAVH